MKKRKWLLTCLFGALLVLLLAAPSMAGPGSNVVDVTCSGTVSLSSAGGSVDITLTEGLPTAMLLSNPSVTLTLPNGFQWNGAVITSVYAQNLVCNITNNGRTMNVINSMAIMEANSSNINTFISVDESLAQSGDVICQVGGMSNVAPATVKVATYTAPANVANPAVHVTVSNCPIIISGKKCQTIGDITISEDSAEQLPAGGTITLTLPDGAKWNYIRDPIDSPQFLDGAPLLSSTGLLVIPPFSATNNLLNSLQYVVNSCSAGSGGTITLNKGMIDLSADFTGDLNITVSGSAGASGVIKVATVVAPVTAALEPGAVSAQILCGVQDQALPNITITENVAGAISSVATNNTLLIYFPAGVTPSLPTVQVTAGDLVINPSSISRSVTSDGRWYYSISVIYSSTTASTIKLSNIKVSVDQNLPVGSLNLAIKGLSLVETSSSYMFPGATTAAYITAGQVYLTAPIANNGIVVSGLVQLESGYGPGVYVSLVNPSTESSVMQVFTDASGNYQLANVQPGTYNLVATHKGFLKAASSTISVSTSSVSVPALTMKAGDLNGDNKIDLLDVATFAKNYGSIGN